MWYTHVNRNTINANTKHGTSKPAVRFQRGKYGKPRYALKVRINGPVEIEYSPHEPLLPCGARLVILSEQEPEVIS